MTEITEPLNDEWLREPGRSEVFQKWMESLETVAVRRIRAQVDGKTQFNKMNRP